MTGAILVGGRSRRMGGLDKTGLRRGGRRVIERLVSELRGVCEAIAIVGREDQGTAIEALGIGTYYSDLIPGCGPLSGLHAALVQTGDDVFLVACDLPFVERSLLEKLHNEFQTHAGGVPAVVPRTPRSGDAGGVWRPEPLCAVWSRTCQKPARKALEAGDYSVSAFARKLPARWVDLDAAEALQLRNINTIEDLQGAGGALKIDD